MESLPTGTVTFLFTDIEGSTRLAQQLLEEWETLRARHHAILRTAIESRNGYVFQVIGDAFCAAFHTAGDALQAALKSQLDLYAENWGDIPIRVRMGIHTGSAEIQQDGSYKGYLPLCRVQRLMSAGHGGQTLLSQASRDLVWDELPQQITLVDRGKHSLKDLIQPEHIYQVNIPGLPMDFPALKTLDVQSNNLPIQMTPFIGREREVAAVLGLLRNPDVRLVTLTGVGGSGKTRLSLQVAAEMVDEFEHGVWFVELASIINPELFLPAIAATFKLREFPGLPITQVLGDYLGNRNLLLVLDNFEQIVSAAPVIKDLLTTAPGIKILVTSREVLRLRGEHTYRVPPMGLPESSCKQTAKALTQYEAIALFEQRARAADPVFELDEANASVIAEICTRLDGLPLAIELAAARLRLLTPVLMLDKLKGRLNLLKGGARDLPDRQQTMRGAIDWSYDLLNEDEKTLFTRLGVFVGGWTFESAAAVCAVGLPIDLLDGMESLLDKSLLRRVDGRGDETRFTMLETIREYATERLSQGGELSTIQQAHSNYMLALLERVKDATNSPEEAEWFAMLDDEMDNLRSVVERAFTRNQPIIIFKAIGLPHYWLRRGHFEEPIAWLERTLEMGAGDSDVTLVERARALLAVAIMFDDMGNPQRGRRYVESALPLFRSGNDQDGINAGLNVLGDIALADKDFDEARQYYEQSLAGMLSDSYDKVMVLLNLGNLARIRGAWQVAENGFLYARTMSERVGAEFGVSLANYNLGKLATMQRRLQEAKVYFENYVNASWVHENSVYGDLHDGFLGYVHLLLGNEQEAKKLLNASIEAMSEMINSNQGIDPFVFWMVLEGKARLELSDEHAERSAVLFGASHVWRLKDNSALTGAESPDYDRCIDEIRLSLGELTFDGAFLRGQAMTVKDAINYARGEIAINVSGEFPQAGWHNASPSVTGGSGWDC